MKTTSLIEISESAIRQNLNFIKRFLKDGVEMTCVVKGNAYGHGIKEYVEISQRCGMKHFSVFSADEAEEVLKFKKPETKIMIMGMISDEDLPWAVKNDIEFWIFENERLKATVEVAKAEKKPAKIHLEVETGLNRTGLNKKQLKEAVKIIQENPEHLQVEGLCTHYAGAESISNYARIKRQIKKFNRRYEWLKEQGINPKKRHTACSAAMINYPETQMDMVRIGVIQYGFWPTPETRIQYVHKSKNQTNPLKRALSWKTHVMSTKDIREGEFIGYGTSYFASTQMKVAIIPVGYSQGYSRSLSNQGRVLIKGHRCSVVGLVNMNILIANITDIPNVKKGDEVILIGEQENQTISVSSFGEMNNQLNYQLLARLPFNIPRKIVE